MTIIPDDTASSGRDPVARINDAATRAEDSTRRIAAAIAGALEGFVEGLEEYDVANEGRRAMEQAGEVTRVTATEGRALAQTDEMQQLGRGVRKVGEAASDAAHAVSGRFSEGYDATKEATGSAAHRVGDSVGNAAHRVTDGVSGAAHRVTDTVGGAVHRVTDSVHHATDTVRTKAHETKENVHERVESVKYAAQRAKEDVKVKAQAVGETGRRARVAPGVIAGELSEWLAAWKRGLVMSIVGGLAMVIFATIALIVLTIALVVGLNELVGDPAGTFLVALLYIVLGGIAYAVAKSMKTKAAQEREERIANAREEVRHVVRPVRDAFGRGRTQI